MSLTDAALLNASQTGPPGTASNESLHNALHKVAQHTPRYLFRAWSPQPGSNATLNTKDAITPPAFLDNKKGPASINDISTTALRKAWTGHLRGDHVNTPFSSWTHSLPFALALAVGFEERFGTAHISMLDTHCLSSANPVVYTAALDLLMFNLPRYAEEFLAFGVIVAGPGHRAVSVAELREQGGLELHMQITDQKEILKAGLVSAENQVAVAQRAARLFGEELELLMVCYLLSQRCLSVHEHTRQQIVDRTCEMYETPRDWYDRALTIGGSSQVGKGFPEFAQACGLLFELAARQYGGDRARTQSHQGDTFKKADVDERSQDESEAEGDAEDQGVSQCGTSDLQL